jgi:hypothetical protein
MSLRELQSASELVQPDVLAKAIRRLRSFERFDRIGHAAPTAGQSLDHRTRRAGNFIAFALSLPSQTQYQSIHPGYYTLEVWLNTPAPDGDAHFILTPGDTLAVPYEEAFFRITANILGMDIPDAADNVRVNVFTGWSMAPIRVPSYPSELPVSCTTNPSRAAGGSGGSVGAASTAIHTAMSVADRPVKWLAVQNLHATQALYINLGAAAAPGDGIALTAQYQTFEFLPTSLAQVFVEGSGAATTFGAVWAE